eukprot:6192747-Prymnesium_polylepis.2
MDAGDMKRSDSAARNSSASIVPEPSASTTTLRRAIKTIKQSRNHAIKQSRNHAIKQPIDDRTAPRAHTARRGRRMGVAWDAEETRGRWGTLMGRGSTVDLSSGGRLTRGRRPLEPRGQQLLALLRHPHPLAREGWQRGGGGVAEGWQRGGRGVAEGWRRGGRGRPSSLAASVDEGWGVREWDEGGEGEG